MSLYVGGGIGYAVRTEGATPALASHPHVDRWHSLAGLVRDGCTWTQAEIARRRGGGEGGGGYSNIDEEARGGGGAEEEEEQQGQEEDGEAGGESGDDGASA